MESVELEDGLRDLFVAEPEHEEMANEQADGALSATGYGPRRSTGGGIWQRSVFDGDENNYELCFSTQYCRLVHRTKERTKNALQS